MTHDPQLSHLSHAELLAAYQRVIAERERAEETCASLQQELRQRSIHDEEDIDSLLGAALAVLEQVGVVLPKGYEDPDESLELYDFRRSIDDLRDAARRLSAT
jgi:hypothetical protein